MRAGAAKGSEAAVGRFPVMSLRATEESVELAAAVHIGRVEEVHACAQSAPDKLFDFGSR